MKSGQESQPTLTVRDAIILSAKYLNKHGSQSPRLDAELLLAHVLGVRRIDLYLDPERPLTFAERDSLREYVRRRGKGEPVAYIIGHKEFYGLDFVVNPDVLIPRPETETLVDALLEHLKAVHSPIVVDVGTGSGSIACAVAKHLPKARVIATDISSCALKVARLNAQRLGVKMLLMQMDILSALAENRFADAIVANPPYVGEDEPVCEASAFEPKLALYCDNQGLAISEQLLKQAPSRLKPGGVLVLEVGSQRHRDFVVCLLASSARWNKVIELRDAARVVRGIMAVAEE